MSAVRYIFLLSHIDRIWQNTLISWRRKMYLNELVYFKGFQIRDGDKSLRRLNVNSVPLRFTINDDLYLTCDCFSWVRKGFYRSTYITCKKKRNSDFFFCQFTGGRILHHPWIQYCLFQNSRFVMIHLLVSRALVTTI